MGWLAVPKDWIASFGDIVKFSGRVIREVFGLRVFKFFGEALRQAGILIVGSTIVIWSLCFIIGLQCGIEGAYLNRSIGAPAYSGVFAAWCGLRELIPYAFGYMMAAKIGTGLVAELGAMRVDEEIDALDAMSVRSLAYLAGTRLLGCALVLPAAYILAVAAADAGAALMGLGRFHDVSGGTWRQFFLLFQDPTDLIFSGLKGLAISAWVVVVSLSYGYGVRGWPVDVGSATARSMAVNIVGVTFISTAGTLLFWGANPRLPLG